MGVTRVVPMFPPGKADTVLSYATATVRGSRLLAPELSATAAGDSRPVQPVDQFGAPT
jgi:hypothetical protein